MHGHMNVKTIRQTRPCLTDCFRPVVVHRSSQVLKQDPFTQ